MQTPPSCCSHHQVLLRAFFMSFQAKLCRTMNFLGRQHLYGPNIANPAWLAGGTNSKREYKRWV